MIGIVSDTDSIDQATPFDRDDGRPARREPAGGATR